MSETPEAAQIHRGLKGVYFDRSRVCFIDGRAGELAVSRLFDPRSRRASTFEETCYLLLHGELPSRDALARFDGELKAARTPSRAAIYDIIRAVQATRIRWTCCARPSPRSPHSTPTSPTIRRRRRCARASG